MLKVFLLIIPLALALDLLWLGVIGVNFYKQHLGFLMRPQPLWASAAFVYLAIPLAVVLFALPKATSATSAFLWSALLGILIYAIYEFTNHSLFTGWPLVVVLVDTLWGGVLSGLLGLAAYHLKAFFS